MTNTDRDSVKVSVVMPVYNRSDLVADAINSVLAQDYKNWQLVVVDDGSTDETFEMLRPYRDHENVRLIRQENAGQSVARNVAIQHSDGDWVAFLDSDNRWLPHKLKVQVQAVSERPDTDIVFGDIERFGASVNESIQAPTRVRPSGEVFDELLLNNFVNFNTSMVRANRLREIGGFDPTLRCGEDYDLWLRLAPNNRFLYLPGVVTQYRVEGERVSDNVRGVFEANRYSVRNAIRSNSHLLSRSQEKMIWARLYSRFARGLSEQTDYRGALVAAFKAVLLAPVETRFWRTLLAVVVKPLRR